MSSLPYHYQLKFNGLLQWKGLQVRKTGEWIHRPSDDDTTALLVEKTIEGLMSEYVKRGFQIHVVTCENRIVEVVETRRYWHSGTSDLVYLDYKSETSCEFYTDANADVGSPIAASTVAIILAVLALVGTALKVALMFYAISFVDKHLEDLKTGLDEVFGEGAGAIAILFLLFAVLAVAALFLFRKK